jgi:hypothetical protein
MKNYVIILLLFWTMTTHAQVLGNRNIITKTYPLSQVDKINIQMYAKIFIDMDAKPGITITGESNLIDLVGQDLTKGELTLDQLRWIEPSEDLIIKIGAPALKEIEMGTHGKVMIQHIHGSIFKAVVPLGEVVLQGEVEELSVISESGFVEATELDAKVAYIKIKNDGRARVNVSKSVECELGEDSIFENANPSAASQNCVGLQRNKEINPEVNRYIDLKIKNNSIQRKHFVVVGPKPDGRKFSYGFPLMPQQSKAERWTVGTKVYAEKTNGERTLLVTLTEQDENQTVALFKE